MKQSLVVGGGSGLGAAVVKRLADRGDKVVVVGRTKPAARVPIEKFYALDATTVDWPDLYREMERATGRKMDSAIFVAGRAVFGKTSLVPLEAARRIFDLNFWACSGAARAAAEYWSEGGRRGRFLAVLSIAARRAVPFESYYAASKAAAARFLEGLQLEYAHKQIEFISAFPGLLNTQFRSQAEWYGLEPKFANEGADVSNTAQAILDLLDAKRKARVIGWRERTIDLADHLAPGLYDRTVLRSRMQKLSK